MTKEITRKELLELVTVKQTYDGGWQIIDVKGNVHGDVEGFVLGDVRSHVYGDVKGDVLGSVAGTVHKDVGRNVYGKINGRQWQSVETPKEKLERLIKEKGDEELIEAFNQLEDN